MGLSFARVYRECTPSVRIKREDNAVYEIRLMASKV
jgi:hypothetical protein